MKKMTFLKNGIAACLLAASSVSSASVWAPTDGDSQFANLSALFNIPTGEKFGIFEDTAVLSSTTGNLLIDPILAFVDAATVKFTPNGSNFELSSSTPNTVITANGVLHGSNNFQLGWFSPTGWVTEHSSGAINILGTSSWGLTFVDPSIQGANNEHRLFAFDIKPSQAASDGPSAVPLPASAWLMTTALLGFLYSGRRRSNITA